MNQVGQVAAKTNEKEKERKRGDLTIQICDVEIRSNIKKRLYLKNVDTLPEPKI